MASKAKLKFRGDLPWRLEQKLIQDLGFRVFCRRGREFLIVEKQVKSTFQPEVLINGELPQHIQNELIAKCNAVVDKFEDPHARLGVIKLMLNNTCRALPPHQAKFVRGWMERNLQENQ